MQPVKPQCDSFQFLVFQWHEKESWWPSCLPDHLSLSWLGLKSEGVECKWIVGSWGLVSLVIHKKVVVLILNDFKWSKRGVISITELPSAEALVVLMPDKETLDLSFLPWIHFKRYSVIQNLKFGIFFLNLCTHPTPPVQPLGPSETHFHLTTFTYFVATGQ